ncbi:hypothetical protein LCGC14_2134130 [marine sediment metagenome]|uniref:PD-(D/E)XK endonuclease-like domain-containing protein n=1 Tax=marine sediment metagenome TaxID=412755 RepID=A0A0F9GWL4_9ZZZZ
MKLPTEWYDNSRIVDFRSKGDRYFFFRYIRHWIPKDSGIAADWGTAFHSAGEAFWQMSGKSVDEIMRNSDELCADALRRFISVWDKLQPETPFAYVLENDELDQKLWDKSPRLAIAMLPEKLKARAPLISSSELLGIEKPFVVPLWPEDHELHHIGLVGLIDRFIRIESGELAVLDVKTTGNFNYSVKDGIRGQYFRALEVGTQMKTYVYATQLIYDETIKRAYIDASLRHRNKSEARAHIHKLYPIRYNPRHIEQWLIDARQQVLRIRGERLKMEAGEPAYPSACGEGCMQYGSCPYYDLCLSSAPLNKLKILPHP